MDCELCLRAAIAAAIAAAALVDAAAAPRWRLQSLAELHAIVVSDETDIEVTVATVKGAKVYVNRSSYSNQFPPPIYSESPN